MTRLAVGLLLGLIAGAAGGWVYSNRPQDKTELFPPGKGAILVRWKGGQITAEQMREYLAEGARAANAKSLDPSQTKAFIEDAQRTELLAHEAVGRGLMKDPTTVTQLKQVLAKRLLETEFVDSERSKAIDDAQVRAYYDTHQNEFVRPEIVRVSHIFLAAPATDRTARQKAKQELEKIRGQLAGADPLDYETFAGIARARSQDKAIAGPDGDLGAMSRAQMEERFGASFADTCWKLNQPGALSTVIETPQGFHLAKLHGRQAPTDIKLEDAKDRIRRQLWAELRNAEIDKFVAGLKTSAGLAVDTAELDKAVADWNAQAKMTQ